MIHNFEVTHRSFWHFTVESILPIIDKLSKIEKGDVVVVPDFDIYPIDLVKRILTGFEVVQKSPDLTKYHFSYLREVNRTDQVRDLCNKLLSYIVKKEVKHPSIYINFRLHKRRWLPLDNIQKLIDCLKDEYTILLSLNPKAEHVKQVPDITGAVLVYDLSYEEQLSYAASSDYAIYTNGAGMIFPQILELPSVMITPCLATENCAIDINYNRDGKIKVLSDKKELKTKNNESLWNSDIERVKVEEVLDAFKSIRI